jgi:hypothetical protein
MKICGKPSPEGDHICWRTDPRHLGLHRNHARLKKATYVWSDREYTSQPKKDKPSAQ